MTEPLGTIVLILTLLVMLIGVIGTVAPVLPGAILIFAAALVYAIVEGFQAVGWPTLVVLGLLAAIATSADLWTSTVGAKLGGASGWSIVVGLVAGIVGFFFFGLPVAIIGAIAGVLVTEIVRLGDWKKALKASGGWGLGWALSTIVNLGIGLVMVAIFVWQIVKGV